MTQATIEERIKNVLSREAMVGRAPDQINSKASLVAELGLDSIRMVELINGLESEFGIQMEDDELSLELFANVRSLAEYVERKLKPE